jgi:hypothetical protein
MPPDILYVHRAKVNGLSRICLATRRAWAAALPAGNRAPYHRYATCYRSSWLPVGRWPLNANAVLP